MTEPQGDDLDAVRTIVAALEGFDENEKERILRWAREKSGLVQAPPGPLMPPSLSGALHPATTPGASGQTSDIKSFVEKKDPKSDTQFAATVAYYYRFEAPSHLRKESITREDLLEACRQIDRERLRNPAQTLVNAHAQGLLNRGERGAYVINTVGENLVAMALPSEGKPRPRSGPKRSGAAKKSAKKLVSRKASHPSRKP